MFSRTLFMAHTTNDCFDTVRAGIFVKLLPLAPKYNTRIVLINRREYPGSKAFTEAELAPLAAEGVPDDVVLERSKAFMKDRAREVYDLLTQLVEGGSVTPADRKNKKGGIILTGWSFGTCWATAFLAFAPSFVGEVKLSDYVRRVSFLDGPALILGYPYPENPYHPLFDEEIPVPERETAFALWVSGYYTHGDTPDTLERKKFVSDPPPTFKALTQEEKDAAMCLAPGAPGGADLLLLNTGLKVGLFGALWKPVLYLAEGGEGDAWRDVEVCYVSCERSVWDMPWGIMCLTKELEEARAQGKRTRNVRTVFIKGANHFVSSTTYCFDRCNGLTPLVRSDGTAPNMHSVRSCKAPGRNQTVARTVARTELVFPPNWAPGASRNCILAHCSASKRYPCSLMSDSNWARGHDHAPEHRDQFQSLSQRPECPATSAFTSCGIVARLSDTPYC
ncbi:hypothetical protein BD413DRAFT_522025 [Trametes elegans]|nr:hypothetical protein BD413DRAFT_522025 [Trametes elegans]